MIFFFFIIYLYFLLSAITAKNFNPTAELEIPKGIPTSKTKVETEIYPRIVKNTNELVFHINQSHTNLFVFLSY